jgi:hypothetical protein
MSTQAPAPVRAQLSFISPRAVCLYLPVHSPWVPPPSPLLPRPRLLLLAAAC